MPRYSTQCQACQKQETRKLTFEQYDLVKKGQFHLDCICGGQVELLFDPIGVDFILSDGPSGGWISKSSRENAYRANRRQVMTQRQRDHVRPKELVPNFQGQIASSWKEARDAAYQSKFDEVKSDHEMKTAAEAAVKSAKTYDKFVRRGVTP
jgi:hypothetical protein